MKKNEPHVLNTKHNKDKLKSIQHNFLLKGIILGLLVIELMELLFIYKMLQMPKNDIPYVIEVNALTGDQKVIRNAVTEMENYTMSEYLMINSIKTYITNLRKVSNDNGVNQQAKAFVYAYTTENASSFIRDYYKENNPYTRSQKEKVDVVIYNCMPINTANNLKFLIDWNEIVRDVNTGSIKSETNYRADIDAKQYQVTKSTSDINPLGFYITNIGISIIKDGFVQAK